MRRWELAIFALLPTVALANDSLDMGTIEGVYKTSVKVTASIDKRIFAENILEIVKLDPRMAYVRLHLATPHGSICAIHAVGRVEDSMLVLRPKIGNDEHCELKLQFANGNVRLADTGNCRAYLCGAGNHFDGASFPRTAHRTIRYMAHLKASWQYAEALKDAGIAP